MSRPKVVFCHDWLNGARGGEKCLEALCELYPDAPIYTLFYEKDKVPPAVREHPVTASWLQKAPFVFSNYRWYLPWYSAAVESFHPAPADLLIVAYGFETLNLNRISLRVYEYNPRGIKAYEKAGFKQEGVLRQDVYRLGKYWDTIVMAVLREEWNELVEKRR